MLDCCIVNSYIAYKVDSKNKNKKYMSQLKFRSKLANELIGNFWVRKRKSYACSVELGKKKPKNNSAFLNVGRHVPTIGKYRRCGFCSTKEKQKRSNLICKECDKALCKSCFGPFHGQNE